MNVFDVFLNNKKLCRAGVGRDGVLNTIVSWVKLTGEAASEAKRQHAPVEEMRLHVGGLTGNEHRHWVQQTLSAGDRVSVEIATATRADRPMRRTRDSRQRREESERRYYERLKQKFEPADANTRFLNVDLDLWARAPLDRLVSSFGKDVIALHVGKERPGHRHRYGAHLELGVPSVDADRAIRRFVALVEGLRPPARALWNGAQIRQFNVGVQAGGEPHAYELRVKASTIAAAACVGAQIAFTVYGTRHAP